MSVFPVSMYLYIKIDIKAYTTFFSKTLDNFSCTCRVTNYFELSQSSEVKIMQFCGFFLDSSVKPATAHEQLELLQNQLILHKVCFLQIFYIPFQNQQMH